MIPLLSRWWRGHVNSLINCCCILQIVEILMEEETRWWKARGHPTAFVSCCVTTRERVAAEMQARTPVDNCCYILDQEEGLSSVTKNSEDHFSSLQVCAKAV